MPWQDVVLTISCWILLLAPISMLRDKEKPPVRASCIVIAGLLLVVIVNLSVAWWMAAGTTTISMLAWLVLIVQRLRQSG